jgi:hypothetical protein
LNLLLRNFIRLLGVYLNGSAIYLVDTRHVVNEGGFKMTFKYKKAMAVSVAVAVLLLAGIAIVFLTNLFTSKSANEYAAQTKDLTAKQVVEFYFDNWNNRNEMAMKAVLYDQKKMMPNYCIKKVNSVKISTINYNKNVTERLKKNYSTFAAVEIYSVEFETNYPRNVVTGFGGYTYWCYTVVKKSINDPWKIAGWGFNF